MSIFGKASSGESVGAIFGTKADAAGPAGGVGSPAPRPGSTTAGPSSPASGPGSQAGAGGSSGIQTVDVAPILDKAVAAKGEKLEWRTSIVDLMKALDIDSSLSARKELATELKYDGDMNDSAKMNVWLHEQVMIKLAENGGKVPADLNR